MLFCTSGILLSTKKYGPHETQFKKFDEHKKEKKAIFKKKLSGGLDDIQNCETYYISLTTNLEKLVQVREYVEIPTHKLESPLINLKSPHSPT